MDYHVPGDLSDDLLDRILKIHSFLTQTAFGKRSKPGFTEAVTRIINDKGLTVDPAKINGCPLDFVIGKHLTTAEISSIAKEIGLVFPARSRRATTLQPEAPTSVSGNTIKLRITYKSLLFLISFYTDMAQMIKETDYTTARGLIACLNSAKQPNIIKADLADNPDIHTLSIIHLKQAPRDE